jgi:hypothetical protein
MLPFSHSILSRLTWPRSLFSQSKARISPFLVGSSRVTRPRSFLACSPRREENISVGLSRSPLAYHLPTSCRASREACFKLSLLSDLLSTCAEATGVPIKTVAIVISRSHLFVFMSPSPRRTLTACTSPLLGRKAAGSVQLRSAVSPPQSRSQSLSNVNYCLRILPLPLPLTVPLPLPLAVPLPLPLTLLPV